MNAHPPYGCGGHNERVLWSASRQILLTSACSHNMFSVSVLFQYSNCLWLWALKHFTSVPSHRFCPLRETPRSERRPFVSLQKVRSFFSEMLVHQNVRNSKPVRINYDIGMVRDVFYFLFSSSPLAPTVNACHGSDPPYFQLGILT